MTCLRAMCARPPPLSLHAWYSGVLVARRRLAERRGREGARATGGGRRHDPGPREKEEKRDRAQWDSNCRPHDWIRSAFTVEQIRDNVIPRAEKF